MKQEGNATLAILYHEKHGAFMSYKPCVDVTLRGWKRGGVTVITDYVIESIVHIDDRNVVSEKRLVDCETDAEAIRAAIAEFDRLKVEVVG